MKITATLKEINENVETEKTLLDLPLVQFLKGDKGGHYLLIEHFGMYERFILVKFTDENEYHQFLKNQNDFKNHFKSHQIWYVNVKMDEFFELVDDENFLEDLYSYVQRRSLLPIV